MKILGFEFTTKKELRQTISALYDDWENAEDELTECTKELDGLRETFPFDMGQVVFDVALKDVKGRYTKTSPSLEYSTINEVTVDENNYFGLVERYNRNDVFVAREDAEAYLKSICE